MSDQMTIDELSRLVQAQAKTIFRLEAKIDKLEQELEKYKTRKDSTNSSIPSSKDENRIQRNISLRQKSDRKVGGQPKHDGKTLQMTEAPLCGICNPL
jgi:transposase